MLKYIVKRLLLSILILFGVSVIIYTLLRLMPGDYVTRKLTSNPNANITEERINAMKEVYGLNDSTIVGYFKWLGKAIRGDFGMSFKYERKVTAVIKDYMWTSFALTLLSLVNYSPLHILLAIRPADKHY